MSPTAKISRLQWRWLKLRPAKQKKPSPGRLQQNQIKHCCKWCKICFSTLPVGAQFSGFVRRFLFSDIKVKAATEKEAKDFLKVLFKQHPSAVSECALSMFNPKNMPLVAAPDDPLLSRCFMCSAEGGLIPFYDVKQCGSCSAELSQHGGTITRDKVMSYFHFGKAEADKIKRKSGSHGYFNSVIYLYDVKTVVKACQKKYGSLQQMVLKTNRN